MDVRRPGGAMTNHFAWSRNSVAPGRNDLHERVAHPGMMEHPDPSRLSKRQQRRLQARRASVPLVRNSLVTTGFAGSFGRKAAMGSGVGLVVGGLMLVALLL